MVEDIDRTSVFVVQMVMVGVLRSGSCWGWKKRVSFRLVLVVLVLLGIIEWFGSGLNPDFRHDIRVGDLRNTTHATMSVSHTQTDRLSSFNSTHQPSRKEMTYDSS